MGELPTWWKWERDDFFGSDIARSSDGLVNASVYISGLAYGYMLVTGEEKRVRLGSDYATAEEAQRACECVYVAVMGALGEVSRG